MKTPKKEKIHQIEYNLDLPLEGKLGVIKVMIDKWIEKYGEDAMIHFTEGYDDFPYESYLSWYREETDKETEKRIEAEEKQKQAEKERKKKLKGEKIAYEKAQLAKLLKKYGTGT